MSIEVGIIRVEKLNFRKFSKTGILREVRGRMYFIKPSVENRELMKKARRREEHYAADNY